MLTLTLLAAGAQAAPDAVCGRWMTADEEGVVHVYIDGNGWKGGEIYSPSDGKTYKATARLAEKSADTLLPRGYVGLPMFDRTEEWTRAAIRLKSRRVRPPSAGWRDWQRNWR